MTRRCPRAVSWALAALLAATLPACGPLRLLRPRVLEQLTPPVVDLVDYLPNVDEPNKAVLARLFATGGLTKARLHPDGVMRASMRIRRDQLIYEPSIIVMSRAGELEVALRNEDVHLAPARLPQGQPYWGGDAIPDSTDRWGEVRAFDPATGRVEWVWRARHPMVASMLSTAGGLVFAAEPTGEMVAFNARTGALLWRMQTGSGIHRSMMTYAVRGKQYVAVATGWGGWVKRFAPELAAAPRGGALFVFALP